jgi:hypothetical protein
MTGLRPSTAGVYDNGQPMRKSPVIASTYGDATLRTHGYDVMGGGEGTTAILMRQAGTTTSQPEAEQPDDQRPPVIPANGIKGFGNLLSPVGRTRRWGRAGGALASGELKKPRTKPFFLPAASIATCPGTCRHASSISSSRVVRMPG